MRNEVGQDRFRRMLATHAQRARERVREKMLADPVHSRQKHESSRTFEDWKGSRRQVGEPGAAERRTQAIERSRVFSAPLSCAVTAEAQQPVPRKRAGQGEQGEQEGVGQDRQENKRNTFCHRSQLHKRGLSSADSLLPRRQFISMCQRRV